MSAPGRGGTSTPFPSESWTKCLPASPLSLNRLRYSEIAPDPRDPHPAGFALRARRGTVSAEDEMIRTGDRHAASLRDGRQVYLDGALVDDVTTHPAYRNAVRSIGGLYDFQSDPRAPRADDLHRRERRSLQPDLAAAAVVRRPGRAPAGNRGVVRAARGLSRPVAPTTSLRPSPACTWDWRCSPTTITNALSCWRTITTSHATTTCT